MLAIENEKERLYKNKKLESLPIPFDFSYNRIPGLSLESIERLIKIKPQTLGQASRIFGIRPTDITLIGSRISDKKNSCFT